MPNYTPNYRLIKPTDNEYFDISNDNSNMDVIDSEIKKINLQLNKKANIVDTAPVYLGVFFESNDNIGNNLFITGDGESILKINSKSVFRARDTSILCSDGIFYFFHTQRSGADNIEIEITNDLVNFTTRTIKVSNDGSLIWAPDIFVDTDNKIYIIYSKKVGVEIGSDSKKYDDMRVYIVELTNLDNLDIGIPRQLVLEGDNKQNDNRIDGHIVKKDDKYYLFVKFNGMNGVNPNGAIEIWESSNLTDWKCINEGINNWIGIEAPFICKIDEVYYLYVDDFIPLNNIEGSFYTNNGGVTLYSTSTDLLNWNTTLKVLNTEIGTRHGFITKVIDEDCKRIIVNKTIPSLNTVINECNSKISSLQAVTDVTGIYNNIQFIMSTNTAYNVYRGFIPLKNALNYTITLIRMSYMDGTTITEVTSTGSIGEKNNLGFMVHNSNINVSGKICLIWFKVTK